MTRSVARVAVSFSLLAGPLLTGRGVLAAAPRDSVTVKPSTEAWYQQVPPCVALVDCSALPGATAYPEDTLHVEISAGQERARMYLAFSLSEIPAGAELLGGTLTLPIDADPAHGSFSAEQADMVACLVEAEFEPVRGSPSRPPQTACKASSPAVFQAAAGGFTVDLQPLADRWGGARAALALLPSDAAAQESSTWHVTFPATTEGEAAKSIAATLEYRAPEEKAPVEGALGGGGGVTDPLPATGGAPPPTIPVSSDGGGATTSPVAETPAPPAQPSAQPAASGTPSPPGLASGGFAYPQVWALPLVMLAGFGALGRSLTKELYRRR
jgi:hypothetical protein